MGNSLNISEIHTIEKLSSAFHKFSQNVLANLRSADMEITRTQSWLQERKAHWTHEAKRFEQEVHNLQLDLNHCLNSGYHDRDGKYHAPDCSPIQAALQRAQVNLQTSQENLRIALLWLSRIEQAVFEYKKEAYRQKNVATTLTEKACLSLKRYAERYRAIAATSLLLGGSLSNIVVTVIQKMSGTQYLERGAVGEDVAQAAVESELRMKLKKFDQAKHGFDRIVSMPNGQAIIIESKTSDDGTLHLRTDSDGRRQASNDWVLQTAQKMCDRHSEQWSPDNEQIGREILERGVENIPVISCVSDFDSGICDLYLRMDENADIWTKIATGIKIKDL